MRTENACLPSRVRLLCYTLVAVFPLLLAGCRTAGLETISGPATPAPVENSPVDPETGDLVAWWMSRTEGTPKGELVPVLVPHPHAIFIQWPKEEWFPDSAGKRLFAFYDNVQKKSWLTRDFDSFLAVVNRQPHDITVLQLDTCTVPRD